jgi:transposase
MQGFLKCWLASGLRDKVSKRMAEITGSRQCADKDLRVIVTGDEYHACEPSLDACMMAKQAQRFRTCSRQTVLLSAQLS